MAKKTDPSPGDDREELPFEQALADLEAIVHRLEEGELSMDEALASYECGIGRLKRCYQLLQAAETKVQLLSGVDEEGNAVTEPFARGDEGQ